MALKFYKTESKLFGYQIGLNNDNAYIAIPKKYFKKYNSVIAVSGGIKKEFRASERHQEATFKDKFKPTKNYTLLYFLWKNYDN